MNEHEEMRCACGNTAEAKVAWAFWFLGADKQAWTCFDCWYARPQPKRKVA
jgi:hypothetical protein